MVDAQAREFSSITACWSDGYEAVELVVDGAPVPYLVQRQRLVGISPFARRFPKSRVREWLAGYRDPGLRANAELSKGELELTVCSVDADIDCGSFAVWLERDRDRVIWRGPHWAGGNSEDPPSVDEVLDPEIVEEDPLVYFPEKLEFRSADYDAAMDSVQQLMDAHPWPVFAPNPTGWFSRLMNRARGNRGEQLHSDGDPAGS